MKQIGNRIALAGAFPNGVWERGGGKFLGLFRLALTGLALLLLPSSSAVAFIRAPTWDDVLVDKSELIVIAHLKENRFEIAKDPLSQQPDRKVFFTTVRPNN